MPSEQDERKRENMVRFLELDCRAAAEGGGERFELSFSSEAPVKRSWGSEILVHDEASVNLARLEEAGCLLFSHGKDPKIGRMPIGRVEKVWLDTAARKCRAVIVFDEEDEDAQRLKAKMQKGMLRGVSVGYQVTRWLTLEPGQVGLDGRFTGPCDLAVSWEPYEISLEPTPADPTVGSGKSIEMTQQEERKMGMEKERAMKTGAQGAASPSERGQEEQSRLERQRCVDIMELCRSFDEDPQEHIAQGRSLDEVRTAILTRLGNERKPVGSRGMDGVQVGEAEMDKVRAAAIDGLLMRGRQTVEKPADGASQFRGMRLRDIAIECLEREGQQGARRMSDDELFRRSVTPDSAFAGILTGVVNRTMAKEYTAAATTYQYWTSVGSAVDFKPTHIFQISEAGDLREVTQNGELQMDEIGTERMATRQLLTFGRSWGFTRQALINDDIDLLTKVPAAYVRAAQRGVNRAVYALLKNNPVMQDGSQLFSAAHKNLGTGAKPSTASYGEAMAAMRRQRNLKGNEVLNIAPRFVLSPAALEVENRQLLVSTADPTGGNSGVANIFQNSMTLIVDAELDVDSGANPYYFAASPMDCDTIEVAYLNGQEAPILETQVGFDYVGVKFRILHDRAVTLIDHRGLYKNPGQA